MAITLNNAISPYTEMVSYETLWGMRNKTLKSIAALFERHRVLPSQLLQQEPELFDEVGDLRQEVEEYVSAITGFSVSVNGCFEYPVRLRDAKYPPELFYYRGNIGLIESPCVSVVGTRNPSPDGVKRAAKLARGLVEAGFVIVSGLAAGIDTAAMRAAIDAGGHTVGVIGTPINESYPKENADLQECIAREHLLISQVPFYRYAKEPFDARRRYFPERNVTMAALSRATIIVEASDTSGTLTQARACEQQHRKLFILNSCFENPDITWPKTYEARGAIRARDIESILDVLKSARHGWALETDRHDREAPEPS